MEPTELEEDRASRKKLWINVLSGLAALAFLVAMGWGIYALIGGKSPPKKPGPQQIAILKQPPPPPPKPPDKPPDPPKIKEEVKIDEPRPESKPDEPKPADDKPASDKPLGVDADATGNGDSFGLSANKGGRDLLTTGSGGSTGRYYTGLMQRNFFEALARNRKAPLDEFSVVITVWLGDDGRVLRTEINNSSGKPEIDALIQSTLADMAPLREVPPASYRQVRLRLNRRT
jgi:protein TonB